MAETNYQDIQVVQEGFTATIHLNRPGVLNAFRKTTFAEFQMALDELRASECRTIILTGAGRAFCAGQDLEELLDRQSGDLDSRLEIDAPGELEVFQQLTRSLVSQPQIVIAALNGPAVGVGAEIALAADIRIASEDAYVAFMEAKRGLFQTNGVIYLLPRIVGYGRAVELLLTGRKAYAQELREIGFVTQITASDQLIPQVHDIATTLNTNAPISLQLIKENLRKSLELTFEEVLHLEVEGMLRCLKSEDLWEGVRAFTEKRPPVYKGK